METSHLLLWVVWVALFALRYTFAFSVTFPLLCQCEPATITWYGKDAVPPFVFVVLPLNSSEPLLINMNTVEIWDDKSSTGSYTLDGLNLRVGTQYITAMTDARGVGFGVVSAAVQSVVSSPHTSCLPSNTVERPKVFSFETLPSQCQNWAINWDSSYTEPTVCVQGFIPGGTTFTLPQLPAGQKYQEWIVNAVKGTQFVLLYSTGDQSGKDTLLETSALLTVQGDESSPTSCFQKFNPTSTVELGTASNVASSTSSAGFDPQKSINSRGNVSQAGPIAGGAVGGFIAALLIVGLVAFIWRCVNRRSVSSNIQVVSRGLPNVQRHAHSPHEGRNFADEPVSQAQ